MEPPFWNIITPSLCEWERRGLDFIRAGLPTHDPYRAWANFEFQTADEYISGIQPETIRPIPNIDAMENLKFSECLSPGIAAEVFTSRFDDGVGVAQALEERRRVVVNSQ